MASCTQIEGFIQAYIDGEIGSSERVILNQHLSECVVCSAVYKRHQRALAQLFEVLTPDRLLQDLSRKVLENLPEMDSTPANMEEINWRAKHPANLLHQVARLVPVGVLLVLVVFGVIIRLYWPAPASLRDAIGVVTQSAGQAWRYTDANSPGQACAASQHIQKGERFETGPGSTMILALLGPTQLKLNENTLLRVQNGRTIVVEKGEAWLDIGGHGAPFKVYTPQGEITVFGTAFNVLVVGEKTTVTVKRGYVLAEKDSAIRSLEAGDQVDLLKSGNVSDVRPVDVSGVTAWADKLLPEERAEAAFETFQINRASATELTARAVFIFNTLRDDGTTMTIKSISLAWDPDTAPAGHCGYVMYVFDDDMKVLFRKGVEGSLFDDKSRSSVEIPITEKPLSGVRRLSVRLVPDYSTGTLETAFEEPKATAI